MIETIITKQNDAVEYCIDCGKLVTKCECYDDIED